MKVNFEGTPTFLYTVSTTDLHNQILLPFQPDPWDYCPVADNVC